MPYVNVRITEGATRGQKAAVIADVTRALVEHRGKKPEHCHVVIDEVAEANWGFAGQLTDDWKREPQAEDAGGS
ncbi:tautomerase family protein [Phycisphaera mikurensis]|uniref:Tautomerase n=1 Tax=Phycisphaera mikurensis (strain NBRC 102666 / KCTC 22515 / FYK2301M01) TaxID=1142394 RepID=I0IE59_PHYMF|nr:4-oxalocrotonate tautomerase family protein [Phycisphaera mikurensis]MBB6441351.1 4-oxalocrotonate tautomerase [Phycisphaera mikurensis]BAM03547.1 putative tautomerase [Phycisphaera mikurensis NBRC 102666]